MKKKAQQSQMIIYHSTGDPQKIHVRIQDENVWLPQKLIADLFTINVRTVNEHLLNIYQEHELDQNQTIRNFRIVQKEGVLTSQNCKHLLDDL